MNPIDPRPSALVVGAGIVGLATARALAIAGHRVTVLDRSARAVGASIRNFGMVWPVGQRSGPLFNRALRSRDIWREVCRDAGIWHDPAGSLHLARGEEELAVLEDFMEMTGRDRGYRLLTPSEVGALSPVARTEGLLAGLYSADEIIVDPPAAIRSLPRYLTEKWGVAFHWETPVLEADTGVAITAEGVLRADWVFVCSGPDFETLFPSAFAELPITRCKLQMMRLGAQPEGWRMGPSLCGGLSLTHYGSFSEAGPSAERLREMFQVHHPQYVAWGIHVMAAQNASGEIVVGDSHEYGHTLDPFDNWMVNRLILDYLSGFARFPRQEVSHSWNGIYPKLTDGRTEVVLSPVEGVTVINGLGGNGMTLSFGLAEEVVRSL